MQPTAEGHWIIKAPLIALKLASNPPVLQLQSLELTILPLSPKQETKCFGGML